MTSATCEMSHQEEDDALGRRGPSPDIPPIRTVHLTNPGPPLTVGDFLQEREDLKRLYITDNEENEEKDEQDAWPGLGRTKTTPSPTSSTVKMPVSKHSEIYNMTHKRRGAAYVFNHKDFHPRLGLKTRNGTDADRDNLKNTLKGLDFEVRIFNDLSYNEIERLLEEASIENHRDADCILVSVLSHGEHGILYAYDAAYKPERLWANFNSEKCPTLAGKPKLFFIQACQGDQLDHGVRLVANNTNTVTDAGSISYKLPAFADFIISYSTIPGFYSWRNTTAGSWFIQALCYMLRTEGRTRDLLSLMTRVSRKVATEFQSNTPGDIMMHEKKQIPCITSMLTREIFFYHKSNP